MELKKNPACIDKVKNRWKKVAIFKRGNGETGNRGNGESGKRGIGETGNRGIGETGKRGIGETGKRGIGELGKRECFAVLNWKIANFTC